MFKNPLLNKLDKRQLKLKKPNYNAIKEIMVDIYDFDLNKVNDYINKIKIHYIRISNMQKDGIVSSAISKNI